MSYYCYTILIFIFALIPQNLPAEAKIIDANTIKINGNKVCLHGIDTPESNQTCRNLKQILYLCGKMAIKALKIWLARYKKSRVNATQKEKITTIEKQQNAQSKK